MSKEKGSLHRCVCLQFPNATHGYPQQFIVVDKNFDSYNHFSNFPSDSCCVVPDRACILVHNTIILKLQVKGAPGNPQASCGFAFIVSNLVKHS